MDCGAVLRSLDQYMYQGRRKVWKSGERGHIELGGDNVPPLVEIGLTDLPKSGVARAPPGPPLVTGLAKSGGQPSSGSDGPELVTKGQIKSERIYEVIDLPNYQFKTLKDFCPESFEIEYV